MQHPARRSAGRHPFLLLVVAVAALLAACSSDDGDATSTTSSSVASEDPGATSSTGVTPVEPGTPEEYSAALLSSLTEDPDNTKLMDAEQAACIAPRWIESITPERLGAAGMAPDALASQRSMSAIIRVGLSVSEAEALVVQMRECGVDVRARWIESVSTTDGTVSPEAQACLEDELPAELTERMAAVGLSGDADDPASAEASSRFLGVLQTCGLYPTPTD